MVSQRLRHIRVAPIISTAVAPSIKSVAFTSSEPPVDGMGIATLAGLPRITLFAGKPRMQTAPAPTTEFSPIAVPGRRMAPAAVGASAVKISVVDARVGNDGVSADPNLADTGEPGPAHHDVVSYHEFGVLGIGPCIHAMPRRDVVAKDNFSRSAHAQPAENAEP
jgi:hypothetical protein